MAEKPEVKSALFAELDGMLPPDAILVSNASSLNPFKLVPARRLPFFTTAHWYAPAQIIPLVEVAKGEETSENTMQTTMQIAAGMR